MNLSAKNICFPKFAKSAFFSKFLHFSVSIHLPHWWTLHALNWLQMVAAVLDYMTLHSA